MYSHAMHDSYFSSNDSSNRLPAYSFYNFAARQAFSRSLRIPTKLNDEVLTETPVIAVLVLPPLDYPNEDRGEMVASYVKWLESAGARVVPLFFDIPDEEIDRILDSVNGVLFTGGEDFISLDPENAYTHTAHRVLDRVKEYNDQGITFPLWGTCLGFEMICCLETDTMDILSATEGVERIALPLNFTSYASSSALYAASSHADDEVLSVCVERIALPLNFTSYASSSALYAASSHADDEVLSVCATENVALNAHSWSVLMTDFYSYPELYESYNLLSTNKSPGDDSVFVSSIEHTTYPIFGTQYHPEKNGYEFFSQYPDSIHAKESVRAMHTLAENFVMYARMNDNSFDDEDELNNSLIYNYDPTFTGKNDGVMEQTYYFPL
ncbi:putative multi-domain containing protein [Aduncisulcus paluster]|uniref:folate gamma-glutamyl hydrolase n=1 Tax=Aduncisulcus paluster TaxID=2918883 RepID=A0ABQ5JRY3_9EUKA|nr:putative multi-domain containing protein [Aduncisulcus paluster]